MMQKYIQFHILTSYPASNLNRDDLGRPKTVMMGNCSRLRVSSQSNKRAWRTSSVFQDALGEKIGLRTKSLGIYIHKALLEGICLAQAIQGDLEVTGEKAKLSEKKAREIARSIAAVFGKLKSAKKSSKGESLSDAEKAAKKEKDLRDELQIEQLVHLSQTEFEAISALVESCREKNLVPEKKELDLLRLDNLSADIALFGRMLASHKEKSVEAAAQVSHAMTVHKASVEDDFFTAVDDLNQDSTGSGHMGVAEFGAGLFYLHVCIDTELLLENLNDDEALTKRAIQGLLKASCTVSPSGKQNSFASRSYASYCLVEKGIDQPRTLSSAFLKPVGTWEKMLPQSIRLLEKEKDNFDAVYGSHFESQSFSVPDRKGTLKDLCDFVVME